VPRGIDLVAVRTAIEGIPGIASVHDLHVWSIAGDDASLTAHIVLAAGADHHAVRTLARAQIETGFAIHHATIQTELEPCEDVAALHS
jgi:cobalt-zinc-cadmium efflux system protein